MNPELINMVDNNLRIIKELQELMTLLAKALDDEYTAPAGSKDSAVAPDSLAGSL